MVERDLSMKHLKDFSYRKFSIRFRSGHEKKVWIFFDLWQEKWLHHHQTIFFIDGIRKLFKTSRSTCALIVEVMNVISPGPLNDIQPHIMNDLGNLLVFFRQSSLYGSFETALDKSSSIINNNTSVNRANEIQTFLYERHIKSMKWPVNSLDQV